MLKNSLFILLLLLSFSIFSQTEERKCANEVIEQRNLAKGKSYQIYREAFEKAVQQKINESNARVGGTDQVLDKVLKIPVVVHVIHTSANSVIGENGNISDAQINAQIRILNEDFRKKINTNGYNTNPVGADIEIEFYLATIDPTGKTTTGITRTYNAKADYAVLDDQPLIANIINWPSNRYLNMWVVKLQSRFLGYGQFPSLDVGQIEGLDNTNAPDIKTDGFFVDYRYFGSGGLVTSTNYNLGRTATHEIGHWLGLFHIWGDQYCGTDYCDDTPTCQTSNSTTNCNQTTSRCSATTTINMIENYMDYSPDRCMNIFTAGQKKRMRAVLDLAPRRKQLIDFWNSLPEAAKLTVTAEPSIIQGESAIRILLKGQQTINIELFDNLGRSQFKDQLTNSPSILYPINFSTLANGKYYVKIYTAAESSTVKLLVIK